MSLGQALTNRFQIGTAEMRVGLVSQAGKLTQTESVGLIDDATINYSREVAKLMGGFPKKTVDQTPISEEVKLTATLREYSRKNLAVMMGQGIPATITDVKTSASGIMTGSAAAPVLPTATTTGFTVGDTVMAYVIGQPELVAWSIAGTVTAATSVALGPMDTALFTAINAAVTAGATLRLVKASVTNIGNTTTTNYFSVSLVQKNLKTGRPMIFDFWKASVEGGMDYGTNASDYASTPLTLTVLEPSVADYTGSGDLLHLAAIIPTCPLFKIIDSVDDAV